MKKKHLKKKLNDALEHFKAIEARVDKVEESFNSDSRDVTVPLDNILENVNGPICEAVASALAPFSAAQENLERSTESKFGELQDQLSSLLTLQRHPANDHKERPISYQCEVCGQKCSS